MDYEMMIAEFEAWLNDKIKESEANAEMYFGSKHFFMKAVARTEQGKASAYYDCLCKVAELEKAWR